MWHTIVVLLRFQPLPDIGSSVAFWASIATLYGAAGAWFTFVAASYTSRRQTFEAIRNLLAGVAAEIELVRDWACGQPGSQGYLKKTGQEWAAERRDWFHPSRQIFTVNTPTLSALTTSQYLRQITSLVAPVVALNQALRRLFDSHADYRALVHSEPALYRSVFRKLAIAPTVWTQDEQEYMNLVFEANLRMHVGVIGGADSPEDCLYWTFRHAEEALRSLRQRLQPEPLPRWYWVLHVLAAYLAFNASWQVLRWVRFL